MLQKRADLIISTAIDCADEEAFHGHHKSDFGL